MNLPLEIFEKYNFLETNFTQELKFFVKVRNKCSINCDIKVHLTRNVKTFFFFFKPQIINLYIYYITRLYIYTYISF